MSVYLCSSVPLPSQVSPVAAQVAELTTVRTALCELEQHNGRLRVQYEEEFQRVQFEVGQRLPALSGRAPDLGMHIISNPRRSTGESRTLAPRLESHGRSEPMVADRPPSLAPSLSRISLSRGEYSRTPWMGENESDSVRERLMDDREPKRQRSRRDQSGITHLYWTPLLPPDYCLLMARQMQITHHHRRDRRLRGLLRILNPCLQQIPGSFAPRRARPERSGSARNSSHTTNLHSRPFLQTVKKRDLIGT